MADEGQEYADAEHRQRFLAALDQRIEHRPFQPRCVLCNKSRDDEHDDDEVQQPVRRQIDLAVGIEAVQHRCGEQLPEFGEPPRQRHDQRECQIDEAEIENEARFEGPGETPGAAEREPAAKHKQQLPAERIEIPVSLREGRQIPFELARGHIKRDRSDHRQVGQAQHQPQHRRQKHRQQCIKLQHVEIERSCLQQQAARQNPDRVVDQPGNVEFADDVGRGILPRDISDESDIGYEQHHIGGVELPRALEYPGCSDEGAAFKHHSAVVGERDVARNEDEQISGAAESVISGRDQVDHIVGNVIEEYRPVRQSQKQIEPEIAIAGRKL